MMVKSFFLIIALAALLAATFSNAIILTSFYTHQNFIAKNLCENRNRPSMKCGGKCCLRKKLNHEQNTDQQAPERKSENFEYISFVSEHSLIQPVTFLSPIGFTHFKESVSDLFATGVFHPPQS